MGQWATWVCSIIYSITIRNHTVNRYVRMCVMHTHVNNIFMPAVTVAGTSTCAIHVRQTTVVYVDPSRVARHRTGTGSLATRGRGREGRGRTNNRVK